MVPNQDNWGGEEVRSSPYKASFCWHYNHCWLAAKVRLAPPPLYHLPFPPAEPPLIMMTMMTMMIMKNKLSTVQTRLPSNLRQTTRECVHLVSRGHFRLRDKDGNHIRHIKSYVARKNSRLYLLQNRSYCRSKYKVLHRE